MKYSTFDENRFRSSVENALQQVSNILDTTRRHARVAGDDALVARHGYQDKYVLAEYVTNASVACILHSLSKLGLTANHLQQAAAAQQRNSAAENNNNNNILTCTLRFEAQDGCYFLKEQEVDVVITSAQMQYTTTTTTTSTSMGDGGPGSTTSNSTNAAAATTTTTGPSPTTRIQQQQASSTARMIHKVKEYHWRVETSYKISLLFNDNNNNQQQEQVVELQKRNASTIVITTGTSSSGGNTSSGGGGGVLRTPSGGSASGTLDSTGNRGHPGSSAVAPPIADKTIHSPIDVNLAWLLSVLVEQQPDDGKGQGESKESAAVAAAATTDSPDATTTATTAKDSSRATAATSLAVCQFAIDRENTKTCHTPRRNLQVQEAMNFLDSLAKWTRLVQLFFLHRVERDILGQHSPVASTCSSIGGVVLSSSPLEVGTKCSLEHLQREPGLNGKMVIVCEAMSNDRYRVEPAHEHDGLPLSLLVKGMNLKPIEHSVSSNVGGGGPPLSKLSASDVFVPVLPIFMQNDEEADSSANSNSDSVLLTSTEGNILLQTHARTLDQALEKVAKLYPPRQLTKLVSTAEATIALISLHLQAIRKHYTVSVDYLEGMLTNQLIRAIGKEVDSKDFDQYMRFYLHKKLFRNSSIEAGGGENQQQHEHHESSFAPQPFTYSIRRPNHYPDGILSIEASRDAKHVAEPIDTMVRKVCSSSGSRAIFVPLNAATSVELAGDLYLHGWMQHRFQANPEHNHQYHLVARARQFSSFMLLVGTMAGASQFECTAAIILKNKDEVLIPLLTQVLPTAREFQDSVASLSPEQQDFCRAFRAMQLESSVFGVVVVQIKPQLEKLLGLPNGALTKEIELTQDLMSLFCEYQIPSDLLSFDGPDNADMSTKLTCVKNYVKSVVKVIEASKEKQLLEEERKTDMRLEMNMVACSSAMTPESGEGLSTASTNQRLMQIPMRSEMVSSITAFARRRAERPGMSRGARASPTSSRKHHHGRPNNAAVSPSRQQRGSPQRSSRSLVRGGEASESELHQPKSFDTPPSTTMATTSTTTGDDFTLIPKMLDAKIEAFGADDSLRSTIIKAGTTWTRLRQENLLTPIKAFGLATLAIENEKKKAFDLLDALSRSGTLPIECSELHVLVGLSHCFENDVMGTIIQDNINPIQKVERSSLLLASAIHGLPPCQLVRDAEQLQRLTAAFPQMFIEHEHEDS